MGTISDAQLKTIDIQSLKGVGPKFSIKLNNLKIFSLFDLILHLPFRYLDKTYMPKIADLKHEGYFLIEASVVGSKSFAGNRSQILKVTLEDETASIDAIFFNAYLSFAQNFVRSRRVVLFGPVKQDPYTLQFTMQHPEVEFLHGNEDIQVEKYLTPIYHLTDKMPQNTMRKIVKAGIDFIEQNNLEELLPEDLNPYKLTLNEAIINTHYPLPQPDHKEQNISLLTSFKRICFEELIAYQLTLLSLKRKVSTLNSYKINYLSEIQNQLLSKLAFKPTNAQLRVFNEIITDLSSDKPMMRLVHGDVGSGKTLVAIMTLLQMAKNGVQSVLLAPTELLALQHFYKINSILNQFGINVVLLNSSLKKNQRQQILSMIKEGSAQVIIGTHAVFQEDVIYKNLYLAIIDEQHRFGIDQRKTLLKKAPKNFAMHQLAMTATPIPRTLQLALYSDLDVSVIDELPKGRKPIQTAIINNDRKNEVIERVKNICNKGVQVYWVCPLIDDNEELDVSSVKNVYQELQQKLPHLNIALIHGELSTIQKNLIMDKFIKGEINILVATTIIEVGVDVPNASVMIIEDAHRLGLAQLHQLRGRVGRGANQSYCLLLYKDNQETDIAKERLLVMKETNDGFLIANKDLQLRGPGEILGKAQSGFNNFKVADVNRDFDLIENSRTVALELVKTNPQLCDKLIYRWFSQYLKQTKQK